MENIWSIYLGVGEEENFKIEERIYTFEEIRKMNDDELYDFLTNVYTNGMEGNCGG